MEQALLKTVAHNVWRFREGNRQTQQDLADAARLPVSVIVDMESNAGQIDEDAVVAVADALNRSVGELIREPLRLNHIRFRARRSLDRAVRENVVDSCARWIKEYCFVEDELDAPTSFATLPQINESRNIPEYAGIVRERLGLGKTAPIADVADVLAACNVKLWYNPANLDGDVFGLSIRESSRETGVVVFIGGLSTERIIFTTIHEFAHLLLHTSSFNLDAADENDAEEREADLFASHFLMPKDAFLKRWNDCVASSLVEKVLIVKRYFRVSYLTVLRRLVEEKICGKSILWKYADDYQDKYGVDLKDHTEPNPLSVFDKPQGRFDSLVCRAALNDKVSVGRAAEIMRIPTLQAYDLINRVGKGR
ncbi:MAG: ImmA/IrrE family metallo-endopeptidase [Thermoguttaceae bacterium]|nr:ImmA/IrrE family metallo-endopeptidase [Thermoguttaceae bacterium]